MKTKSILFILLSIVLCSCGSRKKAQLDDTQAALPCGPSFNADSAYAFCEAQCAFGPRTMNSAAHDRCGEWIADKFRSYGMTVTTQQATLRGYDGTPLRSTNIIASHRPDRQERVLLCAHWDSRPWADNDPDTANWRKPVMGANDGASGVAVMLEIARLLATADSLVVGVDFICFDAEDWGTPQWADRQSDEDTYALGAQHWAEQAAAGGYTARYGILLDMVGGLGARFHQEMVSLEYARDIVDKVWAAAVVVGYGSHFPATRGGMISDDHVPLNQTAKIPTIDIINHYPECEASTFGPTWHTVTDDMEHIDRSTLQAVGQTIVQVLYSEK